MFLCITPGIRMDVEKLDRIFRSSRGMFSTRSSDLRKRLIFFICFVLLALPFLYTIKRKDRIKDYINTHRPSHIAQVANNGASIPKEAGVRQLTDQSIKQLNNRTLGVGSRRCA